VETNHASGSHNPTAHQSARVAADAQVPEPGWRWPMPKKVAISQGRRERVGGELLTKQTCRDVTKKGF
jgi:hypothetical protein